MQASGSEFVKLSHRTRITAEGLGSMGHGTLPPSKEIVNKLQLLPCFSRMQYAGAYVLRYSTADSCYSFALKDTLAVRETHEPS